MDGLSQYRRQISDKPQPAHAGSSPTAFNCLSHLICEEQVRKIHTCCMSQTVKSPSPGGYIQQFELAISGVALELHFNQSIKVDCLEETLCKLFNFRRLDAFHIRRGPSKFMGMLTLATRH